MSEVDTNIAAKTVNAPDVPLCLGLTREAVPAFAMAFAVAEVGEEEDFEKARKKLEKALLKATATKLDGYISAAALLGDVHLSAAQYDAQIAEAVLKALAASGITDAKSAAKRAKLVTLALKSGVPALLPAGGEKLKAYLERIGYALEWTIVEGSEPVPTLLPDGRPIYERNTDGSMTKPGPKTATPDEKAAKEALKTLKAETLKTFSEALKPDASAGSVADDEGGFNARRDVAAASILRGSPEKGERLARILRDHLELYLKFEASTLEAADEADRARAAKEAKTAKTPDTSKEDRALNAQLLAMSSAKSNGAAKNGAAN